MHRPQLILASLFGAFTSLGCVRAAASAEGVPVASAALATPKLVVFITVDQLRADMLDRYRGDMRHGLARLMRGAWFVNAFQDHAITETAPGHASILSGRFPRSTGITSNAAGVVDPNYGLLTGLPTEIGASPHRFVGTTLFDWLAATSPNTRALSVSMKDRSAILTIGKSKQDVYWYSTIGSFTTSTYYRDTLPTWVREFNARRIPYSYAGREWTLSRDPASYPEPDSVPHENYGRNFVFPHRIPGDTLTAANVIRATPAMDSLTALFALEGLRQTGIGRGPYTDIFSVSFSATDIVGHTWGPDSREAHENQIRLDETIGWFLDSLYRMRDSSSIVIAFTGDHGVQMIPELARERGVAKANEGLRVDWLRDEVLAVRAGLRAAGADTMAFIYDRELVAVDRAALARANVHADSLLNAFAASARRVPGVARVDWLRDLRRADFALDPIARRWAHQIPATLAYDLAITLTKYSVWGTIVATHGSPYDHDAHVPIIFYGPWISPGRYTDFARVVDMGPTLAQIAGARPTEPLDGVVLVKALKR